MRGGRRRRIGITSAVLITAISVSAENDAREMTPWTTRDRDHPAEPQQARQRVGQRHDHQRLEQEDQLGRHAIPSTAGFFTWRRAC
jgi:hypothetical protein